MKIIRTNEQRAKNAITLIWVMLILEAVSLISEYFQYDLLRDIANGIEISTEAANANDLREQIIAIIYMMAYIVSIVTFILWFRRAYYNLHQKIDYLSYSEGWAAGVWFVPIVCLYRPYQIMKELYTETKELLSRNELETIGKVSASTRKDLSARNVDITDNLSTGRLGLWWAFWIISSILGQIVFRYSREAETIDELLVLAVIGMISNIVGIPLALITIKVIKNYSEVEPLLSAMNDEPETSF